MSRLTYRSPDGRAGVGGTGVGLTGANGTTSGETGTGATGMSRTPADRTCIGDRHTGGTGGGRAGMEPAPGPGEHPATTGAHRASGRATTATPGADGYAATTAAAAAATFAAPTSRADATDAAGATSDPSSDSSPAIRASTLSAPDPRGAGRQLVGLGAALVSAAAFGGSGAFSAGMFESGWSPAAAVIARVGLSALLLAVPCLLVVRRRPRPTRRQLRQIVVFGVAGIAVVQLCYFSAITHLSVGVALLIEYLAPVLLVGWAWARQGRTPGRRTLVGTALASVGLVLVLDLFGPQRVSLVGVLWATGAALGLVVYFLVSADVDVDVPPLVLTTGGLAVAAVTLGGLAAVGVLPFAATTHPVTLAGGVVPWWVPVAGLAIVAGALAYTSGIVAARRLGPTLASFVGLTEVLFAVVFAWALLGQALQPLQLVGGAVILVGVALVRADPTSTA